MLTPLVILAFAHERSESKPPIRNLLKEQLQVSALLAPLAQQHLCEVRLVVNVTVERLAELIEREGRRVVGLHYASDVATLIRAREGKRRSVERALRGRLGRQLGALPALRWVFLSGDGGQEQAESLIQAGVPFVMRSHNLVSDDAAYRLAYFFYQALGQGQPLGAACEEALREVRRDYMNKAKLSYGHELPSGYGSDWPFEYHVHPRLPAPLSWSFLAGSPTAEGLPRRSELPLPELPFRDLAPFSSEDAGLFAGRNALTRDLCDLLRAPDRPPVVVVYGPPGAGKTSLLCAQVLPLLRRDFSCRYAQFSPDGLSGLAAALGVDEQTPLLKAWFDLEGAEASSALTPQAITDLMNEVQALFRSNYRSDKADFSHFLQAVRALWLQDDTAEGENLLERLGQVFEQQGLIQQQAEQPGPTAPPLLVCLDEAERAFGDHGDRGELDAPTARRQERLWEVVRALCVDPERVLRGALILLVREERLPHLRRRLDRARIAHACVYVPHLRRDEVVTYLQRFREPDLQERYPLILDERLPARLAHDLTGAESAGAGVTEVDELSLGDGGAAAEEVGARLQATLRLLWRRSPRRPALWTEEVYAQALEALGGLSLRALLGARVGELVEVMRAQGDEDFNERLALDLLRHLALCAAAPARFAEWVARFRPAAAALGAGAAAAREGWVDVEPFLAAYLGWGEALPAPWGARRAALADQALWALSQAVEFGLLRGRLSAGEVLPSGALRLSHPRALEVIEERWEREVGASTRQVLRFMDLLAAEEPISADEAERTRAAFLHTRLPSAAEAAALSRGAEVLAARAARASAAARQRRLLTWAAGLALTLSLARCAQVSTAQLELERAREGLRDRVRVYAAERLAAQGEVSAAASLLGEVGRLSQEGWTKAALRALSSPLAAGRLSAAQPWRAAQLSPLSLLAEGPGGAHLLWSLSPSADGAPLGAPLSLGAAERAARSPQGDAWVTLEGGALRFWGLSGALGEAPLPPLGGALRALALGARGQVAVVLDEEGALTLSSPAFTQPLAPALGAPTREALVSPSGQALLARDAAGQLTLISLRERRPTATLAPPAGARLLGAEWGERADVVVARYAHADGARSARLYPLDGAPVELYRGAQEPRWVAPSPRGAALLGFADGALLWAQPEGARALSARLKGRRAWLTGEGAAVIEAEAPGEGAWWVDLTERAAPRPLTGLGERRAVRLSEEGDAALVLSARGVRAWSALTGAHIGDYETPDGELLDASAARGLLHAAFSVPQGAQSARLDVWPLSSAPLWRRLSWPGDEPSAAAWSLDGARLAVGDAVGGLTLWAEGGERLSARLAGHAAAVSAVAFTGRGGLLTAAADQSAVAREAAGGAPERALGAHEAPITLMALSDDGARLLTADSSGVVALWGADGAPLTPAWRAHAGPLRAAAFSRDAAALATASAGGEVRLWRLDGGAPVAARLIPRAARQVAVVESAGGLAALTLDQRGAVERWPEGGGDGEVLLPDLEGFALGALHPDRRQLLRADAGGRAWRYDLSDARTLRAPVEVEHRAGPLSAAAWLDGEALLGGEGGEVWAWSPAEGGRRLGRHEGAVEQLLPSPRGDALLSRSATQASLWRGPFDAESLARRLRASARLCVSAEERARLLGESPEEATQALGRCLEAAREGGR